MVFTSIPFLVFLPLFMVAYFSTRGTVRLIVCIVGSYIFYGWWDWRFLGLIILSTLIDYLIGLRLEKASEHRVRLWLLRISLVANLSMLGVFKYFNFFADGFVRIASAVAITVRPPDIDIILPVGISFFTFQTMSYTIDVYRRRIRAEPSLLRFATFVGFFPQLVAGPIVRASSFLPQLRVDHRFCWDRLVQGVLMVAWGYVLKTVVADSLAHVADLRFASPELYNSAALLIGVLFYAFQIYCDFNGYSLIAIGVAKILGIDFGRNFDRPYFAVSFSDFWQRWHISLSTWLRDYLYIPLGGNRKGPTRTYVNLMITMLLGGLWHGAGLQFIVWGGLHGLYLVGERVLTNIRGLVAGNRKAHIAERYLASLTVFVLVCVAWVFFRATSLADAMTILHSIFIDRDYHWASVPQKFHVVKGLGLIVMLFAIEGLSFRYHAAEIFQRRPALVPLALAAMLWCISLLGTFGSQTFIYFQF
jgi:alginate O-acetyltransferase complex protein AlgI